jgi:site-specific recombinase XerD
MTLRNRQGTWHYRFKVDGRECSGTTRLAAPKQNETRAKNMEAEHRLALLEGRSPKRRVMTRRFSDAAEQFLAWAQAEYRAHPNSYKRIATSFASAITFFGEEPVSLLTPSRIEAYKQWRITEHQIRDITLRHDLHALSTFFRYANKENWTRDNPVREVKIPTDADAIRMHVLNEHEEQEYFKRATKHQDLFDLGRLMLNQGMRPEEVQSLRKADINLEVGQLTSHGEVQSISPYTGPHR